MGLALLWSSCGEPRGSPQCTHQLHSAFENDGSSEANHFVNLEHLFSPKKTIAEANKKIKKKQPGYLNLSLQIMATKAKLEFNFLFLNSWLCLKKKKHQ